MIFSSAVTLDRLFSLPFYHPNRIVSNQVNFIFRIEKIHYLLLVERSRFSYRMGFDFGNILEVFHEILLDWVPHHWQDDSMDTNSPLNYSVYGVG